MYCEECGKESLKEVQGVLICAECSNGQGNLQVNQLSFSHQNVEGTFMPLGGGSSYHTARGFMRDSSEYPLQKAFEEIHRLAERMKIPKTEEEAACRAYKLARHHNCIKGRKAKQVIAAALYLACRQKQLSYLLIDFADASEEDLFTLGSVYRKLVRLLKTEIPIIDPSLYIPRFCSKLKFEDKQRQVAMTAMRLVQRMGRDWITTGRRPNGICGAAILISAKYHGIKRSTQKVLEVVKVCNDTIRKRLEEFLNTKIASLTREEFEAIDLNSIELGECDPPSYKPYVPPMKALTAEDPLPAIKAEPYDESLSDLDDAELDQFILTDQESKLKSLIWHQLNHDWLEKQKIKHANEPCKQHKAPRVPREPIPPATNAVEAIINSGQFGYNVDKGPLESLLYGASDTYFPLPFKRSSSRK